MPFLNPLKYALHEGWRPSKLEANSHEILTRAKKGGSFDTAPRKQTGFSFWSNPIPFPHAMLDLVLVHQTMISPRYNVNTKE